MEGEDVLSLPFRSPPSLVTTQHCCRASVGAARPRFLDPPGEYLILPSPHCCATRPQWVPFVGAPLPPGHWEKLADSSRFRNSEYPPERNYSQMRESSRAHNIGHQHFFSARWNTLYRSTAALLKPATSVNINLDKPGPWEKLRPELCISFPPGLSM